MMLSAWGNTLGMMKTLITPLTQWGSTNLTRGDCTTSMGMSGNGYRIGLLKPVIGNGQILIVIPKDLTREITGSCAAVRGSMEPGMSVASRPGREPGGRDGSVGF